MDELLVQPGVFAVGGEQGAVGAAFEDAAVVDDQDAVGPQDRAEPMRDDERGAAFEQLFERALHELLGGRVDGAGGFVQEEDARVGQEGARETDELTLAESRRAGIGAALADLRGEAVGQRDDCVV